MITFFDLADAPGRPWKNGGGSTQELACWPPGADMDRFAWRISVATIAKPGPFSVFPGVDRQIMLLGGDGVLLRNAQGHWQQALGQRWQPFAFRGDEPVDCHMPGGASTDLNLMLRRGAWNGALQVVRGTQPLQPSEGAAGAAGLCMVLQGRWRCCGGGTPRLLQAGQGLWWIDERITPLPAAVDRAPDAQDADPVLVRVALARATPVPA